MRRITCSGDHTGSGDIFLYFLWLALARENFLDAV